MRKSIVYFLLGTLGSCVSGKETATNSNREGGRVLEELIRVTNAYNDTTTGSKITLTHKGYNPTKEIFNKLGSMNGMHLIYLFTWDNKLPIISDDFKAIIADLKTGKNTYAFKVCKAKTVQLENTSPQSFTNEDFVLSKYKANKLELLRTFQNRFSSAEMGNDFVIYEFDLIKNESKVIVMPSISIFATKVGGKNGS